MTEDFKKGLATGLAIGGVTVVKGGSGNGIAVGDYVEHEIDVTYNGFLMMPPQLLAGDYRG